MNAEPTTTHIDAEDGPAPLAQRLDLAYRGEVPDPIKEFFAWGYSGRITVDSAYWSGEQAKTIARSIGARAEVARGRVGEVEQRLSELEKRLARMRTEYLAVCAAIEAPPSPHATPREIGLMAVDLKGYEKLLPFLEAEVDRAKIEPACARFDASNWRTLADLADCVAGTCAPTDRLAAKLSLTGAWEICAPAERKRREAARRKAEAERLAAEPERERERQALASRIAEIEGRAKA